MTAPRSKSFEVVRRLTQQDRQTGQCELCGNPLAPFSHGHIYDTKKARVLCACTPCALLFSSNAATIYKNVPRRVLLLQGLGITEQAWDRLAIPIGLAFFVRRDGGGVSAVYPSPAGPVESLLPLSEWEDIFMGTVDAVEMQSDVEAILVNRAGNECFIAPIDDCYRLTGLIRMHWRGLSGGAEVSREIQMFFEKLRRRAGKEAAYA